VIRLKDGTGLFVQGQHGIGRYGWVLSVAVMDEDKPFICPMVLRQHNYTMSLEVLLPAGAVVTLERLP